MEKTRVQLIKDFFMLPGETSQSFMLQWKQLTEADKEELAVLICEQTGDTIKTA